MRWLKRLLLALAGLGALLLLVALGLHGYGRHQWTTLVADHAARGDPLDHIPEPCALPPERNFYKSPALADVLFRPKDEIAEVLTARGFGPGLTGPNVTPGIGEPWALTTLARQVGLAHEHATAADVRQVLAPAAATLDELRHAANTRPESQLARPDGVRMLDFSFPMPAAQALRAYGAALGLDARLALLEDQPERTADDLRALLALSGGLFQASDATLVDTMIGNVLLTTSLSVLWDGLQRKEWSETTLQGLAGRLPRSGPVAGYEQSTRNNRSVIVRVVLDSVPLALRNDTTTPFHRWLWNGWFDWQRVGCVQLLQPTITVTSAARTPALRDAWHEFERTQALLHGDHLRYQLAALALPETQGATARVLQCEAQLDFARTAIAIERYRLAHDTLPATLDDLVPTYLPAVPTDVIDGTPLHYRPDADGRGFALYSVGPDGDDDGGRPTSLKSVALFSAEADGDWSWPRLQPSRPATTP